MFNRLLLVKLKKYGFTLIELLVVISIISVISSTIFANLSNVRNKADDSYIVKSFDAFRLALALYYDEYGKYPRIIRGGENFRTFIYNDGTCLNPFTSGDLFFDNSSSANDNFFLEELYNKGFISENKWKPDFLEDGNHRSIYNCRYVVLLSENNIDNVQKYLLHCNLKENTSLEANDEGFNDTVYEIQSEPWICMCGENGQGGDPIPGAC